MIMGLKRLFTKKQYALRDNDGNIMRYNNFNDAYNNARAMSESVQSGQETAKYTNSENYWNSNPGKIAASYGYNNQFDYAYANGKNAGLSNREALQAAMSHWGPEGATPLYLSRRDYMRADAGEDTSRREKRRLYRSLKKDSAYNNYSAKELRGVALDAMNSNYSNYSNSGPRISEELKNSANARMKEEGKARIIEKLPPITRYTITNVYSETPTEVKEDPSIRANESMNYLTPEELIQFGQSGISPVAIEDYNIPQEEVTMRLSPDLSYNADSIPRLAKILGITPTEYWNLLQSKNNGR